jgi:hypothetical protein
MEDMSKRNRESDQASSRRLQSAADRTGNRELKEPSRRMQSVVDRREHQRRQGRGR